MGKESKSISDKIYYAMEKRLCQRWSSRVPFSRNSCAASSFIDEGDWRTRGEISNR